MTPDELSHIEHDALEGYALPCEDTLRLVGHIKLTPRQNEVAQLVADGFTDKQIGATMGISENTVAYHVAQIVKRWELDNSMNIRVQITNKARAA